ncbi:MAG: hypothetical protein ACOY93_07515 [Bacillota bacterium]
MPFIWMLVGAALALLAVYGGRLLKLGLKWFDWIWLLAVALLVFTTLSFLVVSLEEGESVAALRGTLFFGLPTLVLAVPMIRRWTKLS